MVHVTPSQKPHPSPHDLVWTRVQWWVVVYVGSVVKRSGSCLTWRTVWIHTHAHILPQHRPRTLSTCQPDTPTVIMSALWEKERVHVRLLVLLQPSSLCCCTVLSQDYIPRRRAATYLVFVSAHLYHAPAVSVVFPLMLMSIFLHHVYVQRPFTG